MMNTDSDVLQFFNAVADENRLKILGWLANESRSSEQLAAALGAKPADVLRHLALLREIGLVQSATTEGAPRYSLNTEALRSLAARVHAGEAESVPADLLAGADDYDAKVLSSYLNPDGSIKEIPAQEKKLRAVLRYLLGKFEPGRKYDEKEVNATLARFHADTASLRRAMVDCRMLERDSDGRRYWRGDVIGNA